MELHLLYILFAFLPTICNDSTQSIICGFIEYLFHHEGITLNTVSDKEAHFTTKEQVNNPKIHLVLPIL